VGGDPSAIELVALNDICGLLTRTISLFRECIESLEDLAVRTLQTV